MYMKKFRLIIAMSLVGMSLLIGCQSSTASTTDATTAGATDSTTTAANTASADNTVVTDEGLICPYCGLLYTGTGNDNYYSHVAACAEANGDRDSLAECSYCGKLFSTKYIDPAGNGDTMYNTHISFEEWAHREYVMCQLCGEYYKNGTEHVCKQQQ